MEESFAELVSTIYEASIDPLQWTIAMGQTERLVGAFTSHILLCRGGQAEVFATAAAHASSPFAESYGQHYSKVDPMPGFVMSLPAGKLVTDEDALPKHKFLNSEFYTDWVRPQGMYTCLYVNAFRHKDCAAYLCLTREQGTRAFLRKDTARLRQVLPHLGRAAEIHFRLAEAARQRGLSREVISLTAQEVICVDVHGRTAFASPRAELRLREADGLAENSMGLRASTEGDTRRLRRQITQGFALLDGARHSSTLKLPRRNGKKPLSVTIIPAASNLNGSTEHVVLLVTDPDVPTPTCAQLLRQRYHLTAAEIRVTEMILAGHELRTVAALLDVSLGTVRNQLKSIFQKTNTHRQSALVRLLLHDCLLGPRAP